MTEPIVYSYTPDELEQIERLRDSVAEFKRIVDAFPPETRSVEHNQQFNELRSEADALLKGQFSEPVPRAITGDVSADRSLSAIVILGVILALVGLGVNSIILEDVLVNSLGCCISSGGMLLVVGAFGILAMRNIRERISTVAELSQRCDLLFYQLDHRLTMVGADSATFSGEIRQTSQFGKVPPGGPNEFESAPPPPPGPPPESDVAEVEPVAPPPAPPPESDVEEIESPSGESSEPVDSLERDAFSEPDDPTERNQ